ncbi:glycosyltransferase [Rhizobium pisi]|uniref:Glycosyltransferase n=1 Tax=Rhizobium pisi TaxID=574561 RepID=A0A3R9HKF8_9HYPH|nr:glycosyltransferase [Rhizobium pisi]TCA46746.1 glycosyltransferase [Rhizobium pisi]
MAPVDAGAAHIVNGPERTLRIGIELISDPTWMGGVLYLQNLAICLSRLPANERPHVELLGAPDVVGKFLAENHLADALGRKKGLLKRIARKIGLKIAQPPIDIVYPGFGREVEGAVTLRWIPDFQHRYLPHLFSADEIAARDRSIAELAAKPGVIVLSSEVAAADFRSFYPGQPATPRVWHFCSLLETQGAADDSIVGKFGLPSKFLYLPNQFWAHKNHIAVLKALTILKRDHGLTIPLVCTGAQSDRRNESHFAGLLAFIEENGLQDQVKLLGLIDRVTQVEIFRRAAAIVQPSLFEGWSTVVEDTRAIGRPIFLSDLPVHREQDPARCTYFDPDEPSDLAAKLAAAWPGLVPGPDRASEQKALHEMEGRILDAGRVFHDIARQAIG